MSFALHDTESDLTGCLTNRFSVYYEKRLLSSLPPAGKERGAMRGRCIRILCVALLVCAVGGCLTACVPLQAPTLRRSVTITMPSVRNVRDVRTNYYKQWLEAQTGLDITFQFLPESYTAEYLDALFASGNIETDALFSLESTDAAAFPEKAWAYGEAGYILPLNAYISEDTNLWRILETFDAYDLRAALSAPDGSLYYMPGLDVSRSQRVGQVLWLNKGWLAALKLSVPTTLDELREVLRAFQAMDPNGNGIADEIPLAGSLEVSGGQCYELIINAFIYNDPSNGRLAVEDGHVLFAPMTDAWREAMRYLGGMYEEGLISPLQFQLSQRSLTDLAMNPENLLGGFTAQSIQDVLLQNTPEVISNFIQVAPLAGPQGIRNATIMTQLPTVAGAISATCQQPEAVFALMDLMLSEEAFLIGRYGEEDVDWMYAQDTDLNAYNQRATVRVLNHIQNKRQNKNLSESGPFFAYPAYADGVMYSGFEMDQEYINARGYLAYEPYMPLERISPLFFTSEDAASLMALRDAISAYVDTCLEGFITGRLDADDDAVWAGYLEELEALGAGTLVDAAQALCDAQKTNQSASKEAKS